ncbi:hypothetical protein AcW1_007317 [Taiwanofungus camphoratus]|nr:hypothetical protein AcW2_007613 [Antrodia cinnamomea]KAI0952983.1 hypothetical protein AcW1_007317 [Antrodia cinnamomea]
MPFDKGRQDCQSFGNVNDIKASFENSKSPAISKNPGRLHNDGEHPDTIMQSKAVRRFAPVLGHTHREREREREREITPRVFGSE